MKLHARLHRAALGRYGDGAAGRPSGMPEPDAGFAFDFDTVVSGVPGADSSKAAAAPPSEPAGTGPVRDPVASPTAGAGRGGKWRADAGFASEPEPPRVPEDPGPLPRAAATEAGPPRVPEHPGPLHHPVAPPVAAEGEARPGWQITVPPSEDQRPTRALAPAAMAVRARARLKAAPPDAVPDAPAPARQGASPLDPVAARPEAAAPVALPMVPKPSSRRDPKPEPPTLSIGWIDIRISPPPEPAPKPEPIKTKVETRSARHGSTNSMRSRLRRAGLRRL